MKKEISLFGNKVPVKTLSCSLDENEFNSIDPAINLYIKITNACNASCDFCEYHTAKPGEKFDLYKLLYVIDEIEKVAPIRKVNFTGGEPALNPELFVRTAKLIREKLPHSYITLNTNGYNLFSFPKTLERNTIDSFSLSRHHYDDERNFNIFKTHQIYSLDELQDFPYKNKLHLRCNIMKGCIDSIEKVKEYIDFFADRYGVIDFGIVSLWPLNKFCEENFVDSNKFNYIDMGSILHTHDQLKPNRMCSCHNYLYTTPRGNIVSFYKRNDQSPGDCASTLVYDVDCLKSSFSGPIIFQ